MPYGLKLRQGKTKYVLRRAFREFFPPSALRAPKKGFNVPLAQWMRDSFDSYFDGGSGLQLREAEARAVGGTGNRGLLDREVIERYRGEHRSGSRDRSYELFSIIVFDLWFQRYLN